MARFSGFYKRLAQLVALAATIGFNVDTLLVAGALWRDHALRESVAGETAKTGLEPKGAALERIAVLEGKLGALRLPLGWTRDAVTGAESGTPGRGFWLARLLGWLITAIAAEQAAPFRFDLLGKLLNLRRTGHKPEDAKPQG